jgi:hypothetical protein
MDWSTCVRMLERLYRVRSSQAWSHVTPQMFEKIVQVLGISSAELL